MKLYCLSGNQNKPCFILKFKNVTLMLDCGLDLNTVLYFLPLTSVHSKRLDAIKSWTTTSNVRDKQVLEDEVMCCGGRYFIKSSPEFLIPVIEMVDMSEVDVILISNYQNMLALPYITEQTEFKGRVFATEPTLQTGQDLMTELVEYVSRVSQDKIATCWKEKDILSYLPSPLKDADKPYTWRQLYSKKDIERSISKIEMVGFNHHLDIFGTLKITPLSAGYSIGSCNWLIQSDFEKVAYMSSSSTLTTHPRPIEHSCLGQCNVMIMAALTQTPNLNPDSMIGEFCMSVAHTLKQGGNVLIPCYPAGVTYDLFECLSAHLECCGLVGVPMYMIDPVSDSSLAYSNIYAEWLSNSKQAKVYLPEAPFPHGQLIANGRLKHYKTIHGEFSEDYRTPCVMFTGHPSLRFGDVIHFLDLWGQSSLNAVIFTVADFPYMDALAPFQPLAMKIVSCPIDTSLNFTQANKLIRDLSPSHLVVHSEYLPSGATGDMGITRSSNVMSYNVGDVIQLPIKRKYEKVYISPELAASVVPQEVKPGVAVSMVTGHIKVLNNKYSYESLALTENHDAITSKRQKHVCGTVNVVKFVENLRKQGVTDLKVEDTDGGHIVHLPSEDSLIQIEAGSTHIICEGKESLRIKIRDALLECLSMF